MDFLALPEEQAELLAAAHQERPMQAVAFTFRTEPATYLPMSLESGALMELFRQAATGRDPTVQLFLREAGLEASFVWRPSARAGREFDLDFVASLCVQVDLGMRLGDTLLAGSGPGLAGRGWYEDAGLDPAVPRRLKAFLDQKFRKLCPYRAAPPWTLAALEKGERTLKSVANMLAYVSAGAMRLREQGARWIDPHRGKLDWEYQPIDSTRYK